MYRGCLSLPYIRWSHAHGWQVVSIRFRKLDGSKPKYMTVSGDRPRLYNTLALMNPGPAVAITEGEIDAISLEACGIPTVGVPGATSWQKHFPELFDGYREVYVFADGDEAGEKFAHTVAKTINNSRVIPCPPGEDVNSLFTKEGRESLLNKIR